MMEEKKLKDKNNSRGIFYAVIGILTLVVAIVGATFAYFTASQTTGNGVIAGNMANIGFDLVVQKVVDPGVGSGMIPMSNSMVETAINDTTDVGDSTVNSTCVDDNGNSVCQVYKITVTNNSSAAMFVDGYVALAGGSGVPVDFTGASKNKTTMRWAQVFKVDSNPDSSAHYSTAGTQILGIATSDGRITMDSLDARSETTGAGAGHNSSNILTSGMITSKVTMISGNSYDAVTRNYIRISDHRLTLEGFIDLINEPFTRTNDLTSLLVINQQLGAVGAANNRNTAVYYFVVWLSELGSNQTARQDGGTAIPTTTANPFFNGIVRFVSSQGSEVTATFSDYTAIRSDNA